MIASIISAAATGSDAMLLQPSSLMEIEAQKNGTRIDVCYSRLSNRLVTSDQNWVGKVLLSPVGNAVKFTKKGVIKIFVSTSTAQVAGREALVCDTQLPR